MSACLNNMLKSSVLMILSNNYPTKVRNLLAHQPLEQESWKQAVAELGHTRIPSCQLGQCSDQVEPDRVGMVLVIKRNFLKVYVKYL